MALAEKLHHSANRTAEEGGGGAALRPMGTEARVGPGTQFVFVGGVSVPEPVGEPQLQARVQRHTVEQRIEHTPNVQILDAPVPQVADFVLDVFRALDQLDCRAGYRSAQVVVFFVSFPFALSGIADGGTVGGSADGVILCLAPAADCRAAR